MLTDLVQIRRLGEQKRAENEKLRRHLKTRRYNERQLIRIAREVEEQIDCLACGNCCRVATARLTPRDVQRLAKFLRVTEAEFLRDYTLESDEEGLILRREEESGCVFLDGSACTVYEARPASCDQFPHLTSSSGGSLESRMWALMDRATYCPIVFNTLEEWKDEVGSPRAASR